MCTQLIKPVFRFSTILFQNLSLIIKGWNEPPHPSKKPQNQNDKTMAFRLEWQWQKPSKVKFMDYYKIFIFIKQGNQNNGRKCLTFCVQKRRSNTNHISGEPFIHLSLIISCTASLTRKLKSRFILLLQNRLARPHVWAGKHGLLMPWKMRAMALPLNLCSWPWRLISCRMSATAWETSCGEGWNEMKTKDGSV